MTKDEVLAEFERRAQRAAEKERVFREQWSALEALCRKLGYTEELYWSGVIRGEAPFA